MRVDVGEGVRVAEDVGVMVMVGDGEGVVFARQAHNKSVVIIKTATPDGKLRLFEDIIPSVIFITRIPTGGCLYKVWRKGISALRGGKGFPPYMAEKDFRPTWRERVPALPGGKGFPPYTAEKDFRPTWREGISALLLEI